VLPLVAAMLWLGLYPRPVLDRMEAAAKRYVELTRPGSVGPATAQARGEDVGVLP
jgi:NADH:ubiquinone oxidoreductase subunit 4 (subunit M)